MHPGYERNDGVVRRRSSLLFAAYLLYAPLGIVGVITALSSHAPGGVGPFAVVAYIAGLLGLAWAWQKKWRLTRGHVRADARGVYVDGKRVAKREGLKHAYVVQDAGRTYLRLVRGIAQRPMDIEVDDEAEAQRLLAALRFDAQSSVAEYRFVEGTPKSDRGKLVWMFGGFFATMIAALCAFGMVAPGHEILGRVAGLLVYLLGTGGFTFAMGTREMKVSVGADGIRIRQWLKGTRFIPYRELASASLSEKTVTLQLVDGSKVDFHQLTEGRSNLGLDREREGASLVERIKQALDAYRAAPAAAANALKRGGRSASKWMNDARKLREEAAGYRVATLPDEELWRIVEDASASATERAGAALALRHGIDDAGRKRLRLAAEACAENRLRVALETATLDDDDALELALETLHA